MSFRFSGLILDLDRRLLLRGEDVVHLAPKALDLLALLIRCRPNAVSKKEIFGALWPDTFVSDNVLATLVSDLRVATGDDARQPRIIRTVHGYGYAFKAEAVDDARKDGAPVARRSTWSLTWEQGDVSLETGENIVGRSGERVAIVDSPTVSKQHARIVVDDAGATIEDLQSKNGTWIGDRAVTGPTRLRDGDQVRLGELLVTLRRLTGVASTETAAFRRS